MSTETIRKTKVVCFGEIMLRLATMNNERILQAEQFGVSYGGSESNVAIALANYGFEVAHVTCVPENMLGESVVRDLRKNNVSAEHVLRCGSRLGTYYLEVGRSCRGSQVIYDREGSSFAEAPVGKVDWDKVFEGAEWFHFSGISPAVSEAAYRWTLEALQAAKRNQVKISIDLNYRAQLWNWGKSAEEVLQELLRSCDLVMGNEEHMRSLLGVEVEPGTAADDLEYLEKVCDKTRLIYPNLETVALSIRKGTSASHNWISAVIAHRGEFYSTSEVSIPDIVDRVGGGDATTAGLIAGMLTYDDPQQALDFAVASGALKHTIHGDYSLASFDEVEAFAAGQNPARVMR
ncbi:MAG: sugar kinase [Cytophagales bacterium]|nr:sugar kinase [Cytophagales bacterium]